MSDQAAAAVDGRQRRFQLILIKPSHYDDDGYVIQWWRSVMPSNSLAALYGLARDAAVRDVLGPDTAIDIVAIDETNTRIRIPRLIAQLKRNGGFGLVGLVGVQSNQYPRAVDIARPFAAAGLPVVIGGFHVSGCLSMLPTMPPDLQEALDLGITLFAGEAEGRLDDLLRHAAQGTLAPIYNYLDDLPSIQGAPVPYLPSTHVRGTVGGYSAFDAGRGCPYQCSFCTIINVQGRKSRQRSPDDIERLLRQSWSEGVRRFFITDDNLARNQDWEPILDRIIELRERDGIAVNLMIQVDTLCHKIPRFIEKCSRAGVRRVFIGIESVNPETLVAAKKRQNKITEYRKLLLAWKKAGVFTYAGYILGFPNDTSSSIRRDIEIIKRELPLDMIEFFCLTPLPGSEDHQTLARKGVWMDPDMNKYDTEHVVTAHAQMSAWEWEEIYRSAWKTFYTFDHCVTIMKRAAATGMSLGSLLGTLLHFAKTVELENVHPLQGGIIRIKSRRDRRSGLPVEARWRFYPNLVFSQLSKGYRIALSLLRLERARRAIKSDPNRLHYIDEALTEVTEGEVDTLEIFTQTKAARDAVEHGRKVQIFSHPKVHEHHP